MHKNFLRGQLEAIGWAAFFIMIGVLWLIPEGQLPEDSWLIGTGIIILIINLIRYVNGMKIDWFFVVIGLLCLAFGVDELFGIKIPFLSVVFIVLGVSIVYSVFFRKKGLVCWSTWKCFEDDEDNGKHKKK